MALCKFGETPAGDQVWLAELSAGDVSVEVITYGATIHRVWAPGRDGAKADVVLGADGMAGYLEESVPAASVIGRVANRIKNHSFSLGGRRYNLEANEHTNTLHGAGGNYAHKNFTVIDSGRRHVHMMAWDNGEAGFPGKVMVEIYYELGEDGTLLIVYRAVPDTDTPISLTNHVYFNLAGQGSGMPVDAQALKLYADFYTPSDALNIPTGEVFKTRNTPFDFAKPRRLGEAMQALARSGDRHGGFDHNYVLNGIGFRRFAEAYDEASGRAMDAFTDLPGMQLFTGNGIREGAPGKDGAKYQNHSGFCLETQYFPDTVHKPHFPGGYASAGKVFVSRTSFRFYTV